MNKNYHDVLDAAARSRVPADLNLYPRIALKLEKKTFLQTLRARPALMILLVLLALGLLTGVAYAVGRSLGYIPGVGLVEQGASIRVLSQPVSLTRDGITITITQATLTTEKTVIVYRTAGIPAAARPKGESAASCNPSAPSLQLPDGSELKIIGGEGSQSESRMTLPAIPAGVYVAKFSLPCLADVAPGKAPENWEIPLRFRPASPDMTVIPVIELATPLPVTPTSVPVTKLTSDPFLGITFNLESLTRTDRGYILVTSIQWKDKTFLNVGTNQLKSISLVDANGKKLSILPLTDTYPISSTPNRTIIGFSLADDAFTAPLTLSLAWTGIDLTDMPRFTFDPGANPQPGQTLPVNQKIEVAGFPLQIESAAFMPSAELNKQQWMRFNPQDMIGFNFSIATDPAIQSLYLAVKSGFSADGTGTSGYSGLDSDGKLSSVALMNGKMIAPLTIEAGYVEIRHPWQITFDPAQIMTSAAAPASVGFDALLQIEKVIPLADGYYLMGRTDWSDPRFADLGLGGWDARLQDANGVEIPLEPADFREIGLGNIQPNEWVYRVYGKVLPATLTLSMSQANVQFNQPYSFSFDPGQDPQIGQEWQINQPLEILGYQANVEKALFIQQGDLRGFEFTLTADPVLQGIPLNLEGGITGGSGASGGGASPRDKNSVMKVYALSDGQFTGPILLTIRGAVFKGNWQVNWNPPAAETGATPFVSPTACATLEKWQQALDASAALPSGLDGKVLLMRGALSPDPSMFIANLDGSQEQPLAFGNAAQAGPNGIIEYWDENNRPSSYDLASGKISALKFETLPVWSPDGRQAAYQDPNEPGMIVVTDANGQNLRKLAGGSDTTIAGWTADSKKLLITVNEARKGEVIKLLNISNGTVQTVIYAGMVSTAPTLSPDGQWIAYIDKVIGKMAPGIYLIRPDGSERRLLVQLDYHWMGSSVWSPDGKWLAFGVSQDDFLHPGMVPTLVNLDSCQIVPMPWLTDELRLWLNP
jgi:hypothetical protein